MCFIVRGLLALFRLFIYLPTFRRTPAQIVLLDHPAYRGYMSIRLSAMLRGTVFIFILVSTSVSVAQAQFSIRAASLEPVEGWERMQVEYSNRVIWVSPEAAIVASDIESARPEIDPVDGVTRIAVAFTDAGTQKFSDLTRAQLKRLIVLVLDGNVLWAPLVTGMIAGKEGVLYGDGRRGLTQEHVERILALLRK